MMKNLSILCLLLFAGLSSVAQETGKPQPPSGIIKKSHRVLAGIGGAGEDGGIALKGAYEVLGLQKKIGMLSGIENAGIGFASNNLMDLFLARNNNTEALYWSKHYLSGYLFKEYDTKVISFGLLAGLGLNYTRGTYEQGSPKTVTDVSFFTGGLHTGEYIQKYLGKNSKGQKTFFIRVGLDQFIMAKGAIANAAFLSLGF